MWVYLVGGRCYDQLNDKGGQLLTCRVDASACDSRWVDGDGAMASDSRPPTWTWVNRIDSSMRPQKPKEKESKNTTEEVPSDLPIFRPTFASPQRPATPPPPPERQTSKVLALGHRLHATGAVAEGRHLPHPGDRNEAVVPGSVVVQQRSAAYGGSNIPRPDGSTVTPPCHTPRFLVEIIG